MERGDFFRDLDPTTGRLDIRMCAADAFVVGESLATTPGKVVFRNDLMQLIQYAPATTSVRRRPLLLVPPWMNKFYVMDLRPGNSLVELARGTGPFRVHHLVGESGFVVRGQRASATTCSKGRSRRSMPSSARQENARSTRSATVSAASCSVLCPRGFRRAATSRLASTTYLATMVDFSDVGPVGVFIDEEGLPALESAIASAVDSCRVEQVADTWRAVRANDLIWSFYVNQYLIGKEPPSLDLLFWNCDPTNMPAAMHTFFMRNMYVENRLREPGGLTLAGEQIDVTRITTPSYVLSTVDDHIAPWRTTYATTQLFAGPVEFVLGASGHIAGVINPPSRRKYGYRTGSENPASSEDWLAAAHAHDGSWWPHWDRWLEAFGGGDVPARVPGAGGLDAIENAPGSYVMQPMPAD